jgi:L-lysine exporter family protein LysE/ArgO
VLEPGSVESAPGLQSFRSVALTTLSLSALNPHVYLDTIVVLGSISGKYHGNGRHLFGAGAAAASVLWFYSLGFAGQLLAPLFARPMAWRILDVLICITMWGIAAKLILQAIGQ